MPPLRLPDFTDDLTAQHGVGARYLRSLTTERPRYMAAENKVLAATRTSTTLIATITPELVDAQELAERIADLLNRRR